VEAGPGRSGAIPGRRSNDHVAATLRDGSRIGPLGGRPGPATRADSGFE